MSVRRSHWEGVEWSQGPRGGNMDEDGKRDAFPTCTVMIEFDEGRPWIYPLALNGRTPMRVTVGGVEYGPRMRVEALPKQAEWNPLSTTHSCSGCGRPLIVDSPNEGVNHRFCPGCGAEINRVRKDGA